MISDDLGLEFDRPDPNARRSRPVPPAALAELTGAIRLHDDLVAAGRRRIDAAVDLSQLVDGMGYIRRASRQWHRVCGLADGVGLLLDVGRMELIQLADPKLQPETV